jgi:hypothetical protein
VLHTEIVLPVLLRNGALVHHYRACKIQPSQGWTLRLLLGM